VKINTRSWYGTLCLLLLCAGAANAQEADVAAIRALQDEQASAWNRHDAAAYASLFIDDGDVVNVAG
jgi:hypothetical protein